jgi:hypothetical protein
MNIPADNFSHLYLATLKASRMDAEREEFCEAIADFDGPGISAAACRYHSVLEPRHRFRKRRTHAECGNYKACEAASTAQL